MSILCDSEIRALCVCPETRWDYPSDPNRVDLLPGGGSTTTLIAYDPRPYARPLTDEEKAAFVPMIAPFVNGQVREGQGSITKPMGSAIDGPLAGTPTMVTVPTGPRWKILSYGLDSHGYDLRLSDEVRLYSNINSVIIDPKEFDERRLCQALLQVDENGCKYVIIPPNNCALGTTVECFRMPHDVSGLVVGKNSYARCSVIVGPTKIQPGYTGTLTLEFSNSSSLPARLYLGEGAASCSFFRSDVTPNRAYENHPPETPS